MRMRPYLELIRPGNVATALADVLAGFAVAGLGRPQVLPWLLASTACLYAGGIVFNDYFDRHVDLVERPERAIPSGRVGPSTAALFGFLLLVIGVSSASAAGSIAFLVAAGICGSVMMYDIFGKHLMFVGPVNMGLCRGLNLLLGMTAVPGTISVHWPLGLIAVAYIAGVTTLSRGEVGGGKKPVALIALALLIAVLFSLLVVAIAGPARSPWLALFWLTVLAVRVVPPFWAACSDTSPVAIRRAVRTGVLSLVWLDAVIAAAYADMIYSLAVLATAVLAAVLARRFAVT